MRGDFGKRRHFGGEGRGSPRNSYFMSRWVGQKCDMKGSKVKEGGKKGKPD